MGWEGRGARRQVQVSLAASTRAPLPAVGGAGGVPGLGGHGSSVTENTDLFSLTCPSENKGCGVLASAGPDRTVHVARWAALWRRKPPLPHICIP